MLTVNELAPRFFIAVAVILVVCRVVAWLLGKAGQPAVVSEMLAGVLLGPSLLGLLAPGVQDSLFPQQLRPVLYILGQIGLVIFMFEAGYAFSAHRVKNLVGTAGPISLAGVLVPLGLGVLLTVIAFGHVPVFEPGISLGVSASFVGVALAITAFPMLARIITERGHAGTRHGSLALASGALDDVVAWILLAFVLAGASGRLGPALRTLGGAVAFVLVLWLLGRRLTGFMMTTRWLSREQRQLAVVVLLLVVAWYTDEIGLYAVFGAFCLGVIMPRGERTETAMAAITPLSRIVFLPLFFTYSGLQTEFGLLGRPAVLVFSLACIVVAVAGKFGACWAVARLRGETQATAIRIGALMNARGLMQLIALNVGLQAGLVNRRMFTALVLVALVTTLMTAPVLSWLDRRDRVRSPDGAAAGREAAEPLPAAL